MPSKNLKYLFILLVFAPFVCSAQVNVRAVVLDSPFSQSGKTVDTVFVYDTQTINNCAQAAENIKISEIAQKYIAKYELDPTFVEDCGVFEFIDKWIGTPYRYGGSTSKGIDCSGLTKEFFAYMGITELPRSSREMYSSQMVDTYKKKDISSLQQGDLLFFRSKNKTINHVAVYISQGRFLSANRRGGVQLSSLDDPYWKTHYYAYGRIKEEFLNTKTESK